MSISIVCGLGFGDEGKGLVTSILSKPNDLIVRFNGGQQAGHTVVKNEIRHVFSNFGSGTLNQSDTYWSKFCTVCPTGIKNEFDSLSKNFAFKPNLIINNLCPVTTPFDRYYNIETDKVNKHGSCGVGFGATLERHEKYYKLFFQDLFYPKILGEKLNNIRSYYKSKNCLNSNWAHVEYSFKKDIEFLIDNKIIHNNHDFILESYENVIFEGAQGILLDMDFGFFPNVTRSNTTTKNVFEILKTDKNFERNKISNITIYYVTRAYQTRHGHGYMSDNEIELINNENETNVSNPFQGDFRVGCLDFDLIQYSLKCDDNFSSSTHINKRIVITCCDQVKMPLKIKLNNTIKYVDLEEFNSILNNKFGFNNNDILYNYSDSGHLKHFFNQVNPLKKYSFSFNRS